MEKAKVLRSIEAAFDRRRHDWTFHCHKRHQTMNVIGHDVPAMIGVDHRGVARQITKLIPDHSHLGH